MKTRIRKSEIVKISEILPKRIISENQEKNTLKKEGIRDDEIEAIIWAKKHGFY